MLYITNPCNSCVSMWLLHEVRAITFMLTYWCDKNLELPLYGLVPTSFIHWVIISLTPPRNWNPCDTSHNSILYSLIVKRTTYWPNPVKVNAIFIPSFTYNSTDSKSERRFYRMWCWMWVQWWYTERRNSHSVQAYTVRRHKISLWKMLAAHSLLAQHA